MTAWDEGFAFVVGVEGLLSLDPTDRGNWTGGEVGKGILRGSMYGISAASFPNEDIAHLTLDRAKTLAKPRYWDSIRCDELPRPIAILLFDAAYNMGSEEAVLLLQRACGASADGKIGDATVRAAKAANLKAVLPEFCAQRVVAYAKMQLWQRDGLGWTRRVMTGLLNEVLEL